MKFRLLGSRPAQWAAILLVLGLFVGYGYGRYKENSGDDLASSYVGSRLLSQGLSTHLFHYDPVSFAEIGEDDTWTVVAREGHFYGYLHPYVQTPLWAWALEPLCRHVSFPTFNRIFTLLTMLSFAGGIWLTAKYWAPSFYNPVAMAVVCVLLALSQPFQYAMSLNQTHMLIVLMTLAALLLAEKDRPALAGLLLACAAAVKITPGLLVAYWVLTGRWKAALSTLAWSAALWAGTVLAVGNTLMETYLSNLHRISRVLLVSQNNQSFAAWVMAHHYPSDEVFDINIFPLPTAVRLASSFLMGAFTLWGGWMDRLQRQRGSGTAPMGAMMGIVAATAFAPIAWTHYAIVLLFPVMILIDRNRILRRWWIAVLLAGITLLNYRPFATDIINGMIGRLSIIRGQFFACLLTLVALGTAAWLRTRTVKVEQPVAEEQSLLAA